MSYILKPGEPDWPWEVLSFVHAIYDVANHPGTNEDRFSWLVNSPIVKDLKTLIPSYEERIHINSALFRARPGGIVDDLGNVAFVYPLADDYRQNPQRPGGRANFHGQTCLYCSDCEITAINETRSNTGDAISVCEFRTTVEIKLVNLEVNRTEWIRQAPVAEQVLTYLAWRMAEPVEQMRAYEKYLPTQMIAQLCRAERFDGLSYTSVADGAGRNIALFAEEFVQFRSSRLVVPPNGRLDHKAKGQSDEKGRSELKTELDKLPADRDEQLEAENADES